MLDNALSRKPGFNLAGFNIFFESTMPGTSLKEFLQSEKKVDALCRDLLNLLDDGSNPAFDAWDSEQSMSFCVPP